MTENARIGREPIEVLQIFQDVCSLEYGVAPCTAVLPAAGQKCFKTRSSCQDPENFTRSSLQINFCTNQARIPQDGNYYLPFLSGVQVTPARINPAGGNSSASALGQRSVITATLTDHPHNDRVVDPYVDERTYNPFTSGTFWTKWRARNPFYVNRKIVYITGYLDETGQIVDEISRTFFIDKMEGPDAKGTVKITGKDVLSFAQNAKAKAPFASTGKLLGNISAGSTSATLTPAGIGDDEYPASGFGRIGGEVVSFTRTGDALTITRGENNTVAEAHTAGDVFQICLEFDADTPSDILYTLLNTYAGIDAVFLDKAGWDAEVTDYLPRLYSALITEPTGVSDLIGELTDQMYFYIWWDERADLVKFRAVRPAEGDTIYQLDDSRHLIKDSIKVSDLTDQRLTQVWVYHALRDPTKDLDEAQNYGALEIIGNDKGGIDQYQTEKVKVVYSRWISGINTAAAVDLGNKILARYGNVPREINFSLDAKDRDVWVGAFTQITSRQVVDIFGEKIPLNAQVFKASEKSIGTTYEYTAQEFTFEQTSGGDETLVIIGADSFSLDLRDVYDTQLGNTPSGKVRFVINSNVIIGSNDTATPAITEGAWPVDVELFLDILAGAYVVGAGGDGGKLSSANGKAGGNAIEVNSKAITIDNLGIIGGGGGGGGFASNSGAALAAGGGGAGIIGGAKGTGTFGADGGSEPAKGGLEIGGRRGTATTKVGGTFLIARAGKGGDLGQNGANATTGTTLFAGGLAGEAVDGASFVTYINKGDVRGAEIN